MRGTMGNESNRVTHISSSIRRRMFADPLNHPGGVLHLRAKRKLARGRDVTNLRHEREEGTRDPWNLVLMEGEIIF